jgi:hypothetical protein
MMVRTVGAPEKKGYFFSPSKLEESISLSTKPSFVSFLSLTKVFILDNRPDP